jgi:elongator complex protein 3
MQTDRQELWRSTHLLTTDKKELARLVLEEIRRGRDVTKTLRSHPLQGGGYLNKSMLVSIYNEMVAAGELDEDIRLLDRIRMKPMRTLSGVTTVTVLTKPYPCPGKCIFCPTDVRMPKSYLPDEPGAMRGLEHQFDPYAQVRSRIEQLSLSDIPQTKSSS